MALLDVVFRLLNRAGDDFIEARREDGHGSTALTPTHVSLPSNQVQTDGLTDAQLRAAPVPVDVMFPATQQVAGSVSVSNFPATQQVAGTVAATQSGTWTVGRTWGLTFAGDKADVSGSSVSVSNFPAVQQVAGTVALDAPSLVALENITVNVEAGASIEVSNLPPDREGGAWAYLAGVQGSANVPPGGRVLQITAAAPRLLEATFTVNGGATVTIPAGQALTIEPRGNLVGAALVFTGTASYFVEYVS